MRVVKLFGAPRSVTWSPSVKRFLLVGTNDFTAKSDNGTTWSNQQTAVGGSINDVIWFNTHGRYYAVGSGTWVYYSSSGLESMRSKSLIALSSTSILGIAAGAVLPK